MKTKYLLKKAAAPYLPERNVQRAKKGFGIPVAKWLSEDFKPLVDELLCRDFIEKQALFKADVVRNMLAEHESGRVDHRKALWTLLTFQMWWSRFLSASRTVIRTGA